MKLFDWIFRRFGYVNVDTVPEYEISVGFGDEDAQDEANEMVREALAPIYPLDFVPLPMPGPLLVLTQRQREAFMHPVSYGRNPEGKCFMNEKFSGDELILVTGLCIGPDSLNKCLVWSAFASVFEPAVHGRKPIRPQGRLKGLVITRLQGLVQGVGDPYKETIEFQKAGKHGVMHRALTEIETAEFERMHGCVWLPDAMMRTPKNQKMMDWAGEEGDKPDAVKA